MFRKKALAQELKCRVKSLVPDEELEILYHSDSTGGDVFNQVINKLDLSDKDYYGLKIYDQIQWLDLSKSFTKQIKGLAPDAVVLELRFKYYPAEPALLANESTRYYLYLQLRLDLIEGRLRSDCHETQAYLIACILQSELGDYCAGEGETVKVDNYVSEFKFIPNQTEEIELAAIDLHRGEDFLGLKPADSELNFLKKAYQLDTYGIDPYPVKESSSQNHFLIGVNYCGISTFQDSKKTNQFSWEEIERLSLDNKLVLIYCQKQVNKSSGKSPKKARVLFAFRCPSQEFASNFWKIATEHKFFFTLESSPELPIVTNTGGLFKKNHKLKYMGRVHRDVVRDHVDESKSNGVKRSHSLMSKSFDGPRWQGFKQGTNLQGSLNNIYSSGHLNKTMPSDMNYLREEEEEGDGDEEGEGLLANSTSMDNFDRTNAPNPRKSSILSDLLIKKRNSSSTAANSQKDSPRAFTRRSVLTTKAAAKQAADDKAIRRGSQIYHDTEHRSRDLLNASLILIGLLIVIILPLMLMSESSRPKSVNFLLKRMNLEVSSQMMRQKFYLPLISALSNTFSQIVTILDTRLL